jgi:putative transposase
MSPARRRLAVQLAVEKHKMSERKACLLFKVSRAHWKEHPRKLPDENEVIERILALVPEYGRYGYRRIAELLRQDPENPLHINTKRVRRIWRRLGLKVPRRQQKRKRIWLNDGSCIRLRPEHKNHVWSYDFMCERQANGRMMRILNVMDEFTRECLCSIINRSFKKDDICAILTDLFCAKGVPEYIRSDNGSEFTAAVVKDFIHSCGAQTMYIEPGSPWENGYIESFNSKMRDEFLDGEIFYTLKEAEILLARWVKHYNTVRPHSSLKYRPPAPEARLVTAA